jgi:hypothetical protein
MTLFRKIQKTPILASRPNKKNEELKQVKEEVPASSVSPTEPTEKEIEVMLRKLRNCDSVAGVEKVIETIAELLDNLSDPNPESHQGAAEKVVSLDGVGTILFALTWWHVHSEVVSAFSIRSLLSIAFYSPKTRESIIKFGGIKTILAATRSHPDVFSVRVDTVALLNYLTLVENERLIQEVATDDCIDTVIQTMKNWSDCAYAQKSGYDYFYNIRQVKGIKAKLRSKKIRSVLETVIDDFDGKDDRICHEAKEVRDKFTRWKTMKSQFFL